MINLWLKLILKMEKKKVVLVSMNSLIKQLKKNSLIWGFISFAFESRPFSHSPTCSCLYYNTLLYLQVSKNCLHHQLIKPWIPHFFNPKADRKKCCCLVKNSFWFKLSNKTTKTTSILSIYIADGLLNSKSTSRHLLFLFWFLKIILLSPFSQ